MSREGFDQEIQKKWNVDHIIGHKQMEYRSAWEPFQKEAKDLGSNTGHSNPYGQWEE